MKGTHRGMDRFKEYAGKVSKSNTRTCWVLKCDVRKFFASVDHCVLKDIIAKHIFDEDIIWLFRQVIDSFHTKNTIGVGLPLGNLTSQLLVNIYMNEFDQWMKRIMKVKYYIRYADDFVILSTNKDYLLELTYKISDFLEDNLNIALHPGKVFIKTFASGVDFLGWVHFYNHRVFRTNTKKRIFRNLNKKNKDPYLGLLIHGNSFKIQKQIGFLLV